MAGGTLVISREVLNHDHFKKRFEALGFRDVTVTALERDALNFLIRDLKPKLIIMGARFHDCCTPFLMKELHENFPEIKMAAVIIGYYSPELAMYFILNGVNSYVTSFDGIPQFYKGLDEIAHGRDYVSPSVVERIDMRREYPEPAGNITDRHKQIILLMCNGYKDIEIAEKLYITRRTVTTHKTDIFTSLNVRSPNELIRAARYLKIVKQEGMDFVPIGFTLNPLPDKKIMKGKSEKGAMRNEQRAINK